MKRKVIYLLLTGLLFNTMLFVAGCCLPGTCCGGNSANTFDTINMEARNVAIESVDGLVAGPTLVDMAMIPFNEFGIALEPEIIYANATKSNWQLQGLFMNTAYACSPPPPTSNEEVNSISIFSNAEFTIDGQTFMAGDTLNELFSIRDNTIWEEVALDQYNNRTADKMVNEYDYLLKLIQAPSAAQAHRFTIHYSQTNGEFYSMTTQLVEVTP